MAWRNWGRTKACAPVRRAMPSGEGEIRQILKEAEAAGRTVKVVGAGHSFTDIACTDGILVSLDRHAGLLDVDRQSRLVTVEAGMRLHALNEILAQHGLALPNLGDIAYQSVAGAISTATHGTGVRIGNLATQVAHLTLVLADGSTLHCSPEADPDTFRAAQVSLGALGIISSVTLRCVDAFNLHAREERAKLDEVLGHMDEYAQDNEHFEFFWFPHTPWVYMKRNNRTDEPARPRKAWKQFRDDILLSNVVFGAMCMVGKAVPSRIPGIMRQVGSGLGRLQVVDRSDRVFASPRLVRFSEMEYAIPREHARDALGRLRAMIDERGFHVNFPVEVRFVAADDILLSPSHGRETCYIAVHIYKGMEYEPYFRATEEIMRSYGGRPHWGKLHFRTAEDLPQDYPRFDDFVRVRDRLDPGGRFTNAYLERVLGR